MILATVIPDLRYAARGIRQRPGFAAAVVLTLALGVGANAAMFGVTDRLLFRVPPHMTDADRVHRVYLVRTFDGVENYGSYFQYTRFKDLGRWTSSFDVTAARSETDLAVGVGAEANQMRVGAVSASFWSLFAMRPERGRFFTAAEDTTPIGADVVVLSYPYWQSRYGGRDDALGQRIKIARADYTIIGVAPESFAGMSTGRTPALWIPITTYAGHEFDWLASDATNWFAKYNISWLQMLARRKPGVSTEVATADLTTAFKRSYQAQRDISPRTTLAEIAKPRAEATSLFEARGPQASEVSKVARWVSGVALIVLIIAAANVANLLLARAVRRRREVAVRLALGVSRGRLASQLLTESLLLAALGGVAGLVIAQWGGAILRSQFLSTGESVGVLGDVRTLVFAALAVVTVGVLTGLAPLLQFGRTDLSDALKSGAREGTYHRSRLRSALTIVQCALSVVLLVGAGLFVRSLTNVRDLRLGYDVDKLLWVGVEERGERLTPAEGGALRDRLAEAARAIPGVENASRARTVPFWMTWNQDIYVAGHDTAALNAMGSFNVQAAAPEHLATMGTRLLRGRWIERGDAQGTPPVMVVSDSMANALWPGDDPLGKCVRVGADTAPCTSVVGVAENIRTSDFAGDNLQYYYLPVTQASAVGGGIFVRTTGRTARAAETVRTALQREMPGASYVTVRPMSEIFAPTVRSWRLGATMFVAFGCLALALAAIGLYSVIAYNVSQRTQEMGVRVAFGAQVADVMRLVLRDGMQLSIAGVVIGVGVALFAGRWVAPLLFRVNPLDPAVFTIAGATLILAATLATLIPAVRAARVDPSVALRSE